MCTVQLNDKVFPFLTLLCCFVFICFLFFLHWLYRLIQSDSLQQYLKYITIFRLYIDKCNIPFNGMRWLDALNWFPNELSSTELQWSNYLKYSELSYRPDHNAQLFPSNMPFEVQLDILMEFSLLAVNVISPEYVRRFELDIGMEICIFYL